MTKGILAALELLLYHSAAEQPLSRRGHATCLLLHTPAITHDLLGKCAGAQRFQGTRLVIAVPECPKTHPAKISGQEKEPQRDHELNSALIAPGKLP